MTWESSLVFVEMLSIGWEGWPFFFFFFFFWRTYRFKVEDILHPILQYGFCIGVWDWWAKQNQIGLVFYIELNL